MTHNSSVVTRTKSVALIAALALVVLTAWRGARAQFAGQGQDVFATSSSLCVIVNGLSYGSLIKAVDPGTLVGRSDVFIEGTPPDTTGSPVPIAGCPVCDGNVADSDLTCFPAAAPESGLEREIHTEMLDLHLCHSCNGCLCALPHGCDTICYLAGQSAYDALNAIGQAAKYRNSYGEVESQNALGNPAADFPATSFFDIKGVITITPAPAGTSGVFVLADPTNSILMVNGALMAFPPGPGDAYEIRAGSKAPGGVGGACSVCDIPIADAVSGAPVGVICCPTHHVIELTPPEQPGCPTIEVSGDGTISANERAPNTNFAFGRAVYLIPQSELRASGLKNGAFVNAIGWRYAQAGTAGSGNLQVYLQNTTDTTNTKSTTWSTAISGMTLVSNNSVFLPSQTSYFDVFFSPPDLLPYTGGGVYVAFDWQSFGSPGSGTLVATDTRLVNGLKGANGTVSPPTVIVASTVRPETRLTPSTGLSNDLSVDFVQTLGEFPQGIGAPHTVHAVVTNKGASDTGTSPARLDVTGAETYSDQQFFSPLAACGGRAVMTFNPFTPAAQGTDSVRVSVPDDFRTVNDSSAKGMSVNPNRYSYKYPGSAASGGAGFQGATGQVVAKFPMATSTQIDAVTLEFSVASAATYRAVIYGDDGTGKPGTQIYLDAADRTIPAAGPVTVRLPSPLSVSAGNVFAGAQQTNSTNYGISFDSESPIRTETFYDAESLSPSGPWVDFAPGTLLKLNVGVNVGACLVPLAVDATPNGTSQACAGTQLSFSAGATGGTGTLTYQWTENGINIPGATTSTLTVTKASPGNFVYNCKVTDDAGCTNVADITNVLGSWGGSGAACNDGNPCTTGETCSGSACAGGSPTPPPAEAQSVQAAADKTTYSWAAVSGATRYDVLRGALNAFPVGPGNSDEVCFNDLVSPTLNDAPLPSIGAGFWYLPRAQSSCGTGIYGNQSNATPRTSTTCP